MIVRNLYYAVCIEILQFQRILSYLLGASKCNDSMMIRLFLLFQILGNDRVTLLSDNISQFRTKKSISRNDVYKQKKNCNSANLILF